MTEFARPLWNTSFHFHFCRSTKWYSGWRQATNVCVCQSKSHMLQILYRYPVNVTLIICTPPFLSLHCILANIKMPHLKSLNWWEECVHNLIELIECVQMTLLNYRENTLVKRSFRSHWVHSWTLFTGQWNDKLIQKAFCQLMPCCKLRQKSCS